MIIPTGPPAVKLFSALPLLMILISIKSFAIELTAFGGAMTHTAVSGCCVSGGGKTGGGLIGLFSVTGLGEVGLSVYSDGFWTEGVISKPFYLLGGPIKTDSGAGEMVVALSVPQWRLISSIGAGYFSHTAKTTSFRLPILVTGLLLSDINQLIYSIDDRWSAVAILQLTAGLSRSDSSFLFGTFLGLSYNFN